MNDIQTEHVKEKEPGWGERLGFGAGSFAHSLISGVFAAYGTIYLTNVALLDVAVISMMIGFSKLFDVISDAIIGHLIDTRTTRLGKARGWMLRMCIPYAISCILLFTVPARFSLPVKYIYVFLMFNLASTVFVSFLQISHYSLVSLISGDRAEQGLLGNILALFRTAAVFIGNSMFVKFLLVFTSEPGNQNTQRAYTCTIIIYCLIMIALIVICVFTTKERVVPESGIGKNETGKSDYRSFFDNLKVLAGNKYWLIVIISQILFYMSSKVIMAGGAYYSLYVLKDMDHMSWLMATFQGPSIITQFFTPFMMRRFGKNKILIAGTALMIIGGTGLGLAAPHIPAMIIFNSLKSIGNGMYIGMLYGIVADIVSFTKRKTGVFAVGVSNAGVSAANKIGQGVGNFVLGFCMSLAGFDAALKVQSETVLTAISFGFIWIPVAAYSVIFVLFVLFFDLDKQMEKEGAA